jgi:transcriptional regulator with XRE-family HTH domain
MLAAMEKHRLSVQSLADKIGVSRSYTSLVLNLKRSPSPRFVGTVERLLRIPSLDDLSRNAATIATQTVASSQNKYAHMSEGDLKKAVVEYARDVSLQSGIKLSITIEVMKDLLNALAVKIRQH